MVANSVMVDKAEVREAQHEPCDSLVVLHGSEVQALDVQKQGCMLLEHLGVLSQLGVHGYESLFSCQCMGGKCSEYCCARQGKLCGSGDCDGPQFCKLCGLHKCDNCWPGWYETDIEDEGLCYMCAASDPRSGSSSTTPIRDEL